MHSWTIGKRVGMIAGFLCLVITLIVAVAVVSVLKIQKISKIITVDAIPGMIEVGKMKPHRPTI